MAQYKKGIITNDSIINVARESFKEDGFKNTTIASICKKCGIKLGTFTYYFNRKEDLLATIYTSYMQRCREYINKQNLNLSTTEKHIYVVAMYYYNIYYHKQVFDFHREVLSITSMNNIFINPKEMIEDFADGGNIDKSSPLYDLYVTADNAVRREFNLIYFNREHSSMDEVKGLLSDIYSLAATMFSIDIDHVLKTVEDGYNYAKNHGDKSITLI